MENRIAGKLSKEEILKYGTTSYCSAIHSVQQYKLGNCPLSDVEASISDAMEVYHKQFKDEQPIPVNQDEIIEAIIKELNYLIDHGDGAMDYGETGDEIKYSVNDFRYDCESRIKYWEEQLKSNLGPTPVNQNGFNKITLCGSTKFKDDFIEWNKRLSLAGNVVYSVSCFGNSGDVLTEEQKTLLDKIHLAKIDASNEIFVLNVNGYIGQSTSNEIEYAIRVAKKRVRYLSVEFPDYNSKSNPSPTPVQQDDSDWKQKLLDRLHERFKKAVNYDANDQWRLGFEVAEGEVIDAILESYGYNPKEVGRRGEQLVIRLIEENKKKLNP